MNQQPSTAQKLKSKVPKYSDKFKDLLTKIQTSNTQKYQKQPIQKQTQIKIDPPYQFITKQQPQFFFFRVKSIGVGAHSFVYLVQQQSTKCLYAQKAITKNHAYEHLNQLKNQIKIQYKLNHDNLISLYHFYADSSYVYLIMQYAEESLFNLKTKFGIFKEKQVIEILRQLLHGLEYMHKNGYIHADIKIQNIMIRNGRIKLCDFGYATKFIQQKHIEPNQIIGTLQYLSPQYVQSLDSGPMRDVWAVGILCYELWTAQIELKMDFINKSTEFLIIFTQPDYSQFLSQLKAIQQKQSRKSQKIQKFIAHTLCPLQQRYTVEKLLSFQFFANIN